MKKFITAFLSLILIFCLAIPICALEETEETLIEAEETLSKFVRGSFVTAGYDPETLRAVVYPTYEAKENMDLPYWVGIVYSDSEYVNSYFIVESNGKLIPEGTATSGDVGDGINLLKKKFDVSDREIKLAFTVDGFFASMNGNTNEMYRVGHRTAYSKENEELVTDSYTLTEIKRAGEAQLIILQDTINKIESGEIESIMGGASDVFPPFDELIKPAFPTWGYFAIGGAVLVLFAVLFIVKSKKKAKDN